MVPKDLAGRGIHSMRFPDATSSRQLKDNVRNPRGATPRVSATSFASSAPMTTPGDAFPSWAALASSAPLGQFRLLDRIIPELPAIGSTRGDLSPRLAP